MPPFVVGPIKARFCINLMVLNNWTIDIPVSLNMLKDVPSIMKESVCFTSMSGKKDLIAYF